MKYLEVSDYGELSIIFFFGNLVGIVAALQLNAGASITFFKYDEHDDDLFRFKSTIFTTTILLCTVSAVLFGVTGRLFFSYFLEDSAVSFNREGLLILGSTLLNQVQIIYAVFLKNEYALKRHLLYSLTFLSLNVAFQYYCIVFANLGVTGSLLGSFVANLLVTCLIVGANRELIRWKVDKEAVTNTLKISLPLIPAVFMEWFFIAGSRLFVEELMTISYVAKVSLLGTFMLVTNKLISSIWSGFSPRILMLLKNTKSTHETEINRMVSLHIKLGLVVISATLMISLNLPLFQIRQAYWTMMPLFPVASLALLPKLLTSVPTLHLMQAGETRYATYSMAFSTVTLIVSFVLLIPKLGLLGVLIAFCLANLLNFLFRTYWCYKRVTHSFFQNKHLLWVMSAGGLIILLMLIGVDDQATLGLLGIIQFLGLSIFIAWSYKEELKLFLMNLKISRS
ncbi:MAG: polysaccharide biosynthesis C-terminal domain-containing protein [Bacteroidota bacterium]